MLGSVSETEDALQEAWLRLSRSQQETIHNARAWLTTIVGRVCIDMLRARQSRREDYVGAWVPEPIVEVDEQTNPEQQVLMADTRRARPGRGARDADAHRAACVRAARHVRAPVRRDRRDHRPQPRRGKTARQPSAAPGQGRNAAAGCRPPRAARGRQRVPCGVESRGLRRARSRARPGRGLPRRGRPRAPARSEGRRPRSRTSGPHSARGSRPSATRRPSTARPAS